MSNRKDNRGHWPAGRRRHSLERWSEIRRSLQQLLDAAPSSRIECRRIKCRRVDLADYLGVHPDTIRRWLVGIDVPTAPRQISIQRWTIMAVARMQDPLTRGKDGKKENQAH